MTSLSGNLLSNLLQFSRLLRRIGLDIPADSMHGVAEALMLIDLGRRSDFYHTLRTRLVRRPQDLVIFDQAFHLFWRPPPSTHTRRCQTRNRRCRARPQRAGPNAPNGKRARRR